MVFKSDRVWDSTPAYGAVDLRHRKKETVCEWCRNKLEAVETNEYGVWLKRDQESGVFSHRCEAKQELVLELYA